MQPSLGLTFQHTLLRTLVVVVAYGLCGWGFVVMAFGALALVFKEPSPFAKCIPLIWLFAWVAHGHMSVAWIRHRSVARRWPIWGTIAGVLSLASPLLHLLAADDPKPVVDRLQQTLMVISSVSVSFLPTVLLALYLVRFHLRFQVAVTRPGP